MVFDRREEHMNLFRTEEWITNYYQHVRPNQDIPEPLQPVDGDLVISSGDMLHRLLAERRIHLDLRNTCGPSRGRSQPSLLRG